MKHNTLAAIFFAILISVNGLLSSCQPQDNPDNSGNENGNELTEPQLKDLVLGDWYLTTKESVYVVNVKKDGTGTATIHTYSGSEWNTNNSIFRYTILQNKVSVQFEGEDAWSGIVAVTGDNLSIDTSSDIYMLVRFSGNQDDLDNYKAAIESTWIEEHPNTDNPVVVEDPFFDETGIRMTLSNVFSRLSAYEIKQLNLESIRLTGKDLKGESRQISPSSAEILSTWQSGYSVVNMANTMIKAIKDRVEDHPEFKQYLSEAILLRSLTYYNMAMLWGKVVYVNENIDPMDATRLPANDFAQIREIILNDIASIQEYGKDEYFMGESGANALLAEIALTDGRNGETAKYLERINREFYMYMAQDDAETISILGERIANYSWQVIELLKKEAGSKTETLVNDWQDLGNNQWGYWAMLKRTGKAIEISGCQEYELIMPIPQTEIYGNPNITQNPQYCLHTLRYFRRISQSLCIRFNR